jgi:hypothetical protein
VVIAAIAWGAFAFGAVYPWAYWPLAASAVFVGASGLLVHAPKAAVGRDLNPLGIAMAAFVVAAMAQLIPVSFAWIQRLSPEAQTVMAQLDPAVALGSSSTHPLSISPSDTAAAIVLIGALALFTVGLSRLFSITGVSDTVRAIAIVGVLLALTGIVQKPMFDGKIYGFWTPNELGDSFGPFVNKNHFGGWMLMAMPLILGMACGRLAKGMQGVRSGLRERLLWLSTPAASGLALTLAAVGIMALSLMLTMSRSAIGAAGIATVLTALLVFRRFQSKRGKASAAALVAVLTIGVVLWAGPEVIASRFSSANWGELNNRKGAWQDAIDIAWRYPIVGTGLNTYGNATLFYQRHQTFVHYSQAHNDYLQLLAEGGVLLMLPAAVTIALLVVGIRRRFQAETRVSTYWIRAGATIGLFAIALQETVEFSLQMPGNALLFAVLCAIALHRTPQRKSKSSQIALA